MRVPAERLGGMQKDAVLSGFFDADWHNQIFPHPRYRALFEQRRDGRAFSAQDLRDVQVWFNLAWFGKEMRCVDLAGRSAPVARQEAGTLESRYWLSRAARGRGERLVLWLGDDQDSGHDPDFDDLFLLHLTTAYRAAGAAVPESVAIPIVPRSPVWTFASGVKEIFVGDTLVVRTSCPGRRHVADLRSRRVG